MQVEDHNETHTGKEEENGERQRGKRGRGQGGERLSTPFLDAVLPAGPCSLTC